MDIYSSYFFFTSAIYSSNIIFIEKGVLELHYPSHMSSYAKKLGFKFNTRYVNGMKVQKADLLKNYDCIVVGFSQAKD